MLCFWHWNLFVKFVQIAISSVLCDLHNETHATVEFIKSQINLFEFYFIWLAFVLWVLIITWSVVLFSTLNGLLLDVIYLIECGEMSTAYLMPFPVALQCAEADAFRHLFYVRINYKLFIYTHIFCIHHFNRMVILKIALKLLHTKKERYYLLSHDRT